MSKTLGVKLSDNELTKVNAWNKENLSNSDLLRSALFFYIDFDKSKVNSVNPDVEDMYNEIYSNVVNLEVNPLKKEISYLNSLVVRLDDDKKYFKDRIDYLLLLKTPLLTRMKMKLLKNPIRVL